MMRDVLRGMLGTVRRSLPHSVRYRLTWARQHRRLDYFWRSFDQVRRSVMPAVFSEKVGGVLDLDSPLTFNEKIQWRKMHDRRPLLALLVDKYLVREHVASIVGREVLIPLLCVCDKPELIPFATLDPPYIIKPNNGSGLKFIVRSKDELDSRTVVEQLRRGLSEVYGLPNHEWAYSQVPPKIVVERLLLDEAGKLPLDFKFHVFGGRVAFLHVDQDRESGLRTVTYDRDWRRVDLRQPGIEDGTSAPPPSSANEMLRIAEALARDLDYARVDLYSIGGRVYFGEITIYPDSGLRPFDPPAWDRHWGDLWKLPAPSRDARPR